MNASTATTTTKRNGVAWDSDAVAVGYMSSLDVLLEWLTEDNNYVRWRAGSQKKPTSGHAVHSPGSRTLPVVVSKEKLCQEILAKLHANGLSNRSSREVHSKINDLERSYRAAQEWMNSTGEGIRDEDEELGETTVRAKILKICKHYDALHPIMGDRPSARPMFTNEDEEIKEESWLEKDPLEFADNNDNESSLVKMQLDHSNPSTSANSTNLKRGVSVLEMWKEMTQATATVDKERASIEKAKLQIEAKRLRLDEEKSKWEVESRRIQVLKEKALAKLELKKAGMNEDEIAAIFD
ncbi:hypothetical protein AeMF1_007144 [Aphanomyces euteiches]|nr:hypothetical protein AeMF1_007144 [Aphanomyces euteiches]KAH9180901.1 hypothetical protein AeNC1_017123 [Aphanomyces euteiches]